MTQVEHVVLDFIKQNPGCTRKDIKGSFASNPSSHLLDHAITGLESQVLIYEDILEKDPNKPTPQYFPMFA